ncbi:hypothetical protein Tco_1383031, partial [Tanacetum coccineum]
MMVSQSACHNLNGQRSHYSSASELIVSQSDKPALKFRKLVSKVSNVMIGHSLNGYLDDLQFGVGVSGRGEAILHVVNRLIKDCRDDVGISRVKQGDPLGPLVLHPLICFWPKEDPRSRLVAVFPPNIARPLHGVILLGGPASVDFSFSSEFT